MHSAHEGVLLEISPFHLQLFTGMCYERTMSYYMTLMQSLNYAEETEKSSFKPNAQCKGRGQMCTCL